MAHESHHELLVELKRITLAERRALTHGDWRTLGACCEEKEQLAERLSRQIRNGMSFNLVDVEALRRATLHNSTLAQRLSTDLHARIADRTQTHMYSKVATLKSDQPSVLNILG